MNWLTKDWTIGQLNAVVKNLGEENARAVAAGELTVEVVDTKLLLSPKQHTVSLFNNLGRRIPPRGLKAKTMKPDRDFLLEQPTFDYGDRLARINTYFKSAANLSEVEFKTRSEKIITSIREDETVSGVLRGVHLPFVIPQMDVSDYGQALQTLFFPAIERSYRAEFPGRALPRYGDEVLKSKLDIIEGSRHERLVDAMKHGAVVGVYFPNCLQGFSVDAAREQMASLPGQFLLAGGFDVAVSVVAYPEVLARDSLVPALDLAALRCGWANLSFFFDSYENGYYFVHEGRSRLGESDESCSGGLVVLG